MVFLPNVSLALLSLFPLEFSGKVKQFSMAAIVYSCRGFGTTNLNSVLCAADLLTVWPSIKPFHSPCLSFPMCERRTHESQRLLVTANVTLLLTCSYLRAPAFFQRTQGQISHHVIWSSWHLAGMTYWATVEVTSVALSIHSSGHLMLSDANRLQ